MKPTPDYNSYTKEQLINEITKFKKYGLVWEDDKVREQVIIDCQDKFPIFAEVGEKAISASKNPQEEISFPNNEPKSAVTHLLIEGDNYHALTALNYTHAGKIDVIYIDPPYNTGNKDFVYNDKFVDKEDTYRHSKWLSFMAARLELAKNLLKDTGVIFISIDDNEQANLKLLCDSIFGENNFVANMIWHSKTGAADAKRIDVVTEYIFVISKNIQSSRFNKNSQNYNLNRYKLKDEFVDTRGVYYIDTLDRGGLRYSDSLNYGIESPDGSLIYPNGRTTFVNDGWTWKWSKEKVQWGKENSFIVFKRNPKKAGQWTVYYKNYLNVDNEGNFMKRNSVFKNIITDIKTGDGTFAIKNIFGNNIFKYTKPIELIKQLISIIEVDMHNSTFLDFFAGSGTTMHAVMQLNAEDGGQRQCILVTNNENDICENVTYERCKKVIIGYTTPKGAEVKGLPNNNLRYYKTDFVENTNNTDDLKFSLTQSCTELLCLRENIFELHKEASDYKIFTGNSPLSFGEGQGVGLQKYVAIYYDFPSRSLQNLADDLAALQGEKKLYYFSFDSTPPPIDFESLGVSIEPIPEKIIKTYQNLMRK